MYSKGLDFLNRCFKTPIVFITSKLVIFLIEICDSGHTGLFFYLKNKLDCLYISLKTKAF